MREILERIQSTVIFSVAEFAEVESYIATQYSDFSKEDLHTILIRYLQQKIERDLYQFDPKYLTYIRFRLIRNVLARRPYHIMAIDILKACMQLNIPSDDFYANLKQWMLSLSCTAVSEGEIDHFIAQLRHRVKAHPELSFDELIQTENFLATTDHVAPTAPTQIVSSSEVTNESLSSTVKFSLDHFDWNLSETDEPKPPKRFFAVTKVVFAGMAGLLISVTIGIWLTLSFDKEPAKKVAANPWVRTPAVQAEVSNQSSESGIDTTYPARIGANNIVNRSRSMVRPTLTPETAEPQRKPDKNSELPDEKSVIVDYQEITKDGTTSKVPVFQSFSTKLVMQVHGYSPAPNDSAVNNETTPNEKVSVKTRVTAKGKTVAIDPSTVPPGSRIYLKFPQEYRYLNGVYLTEDPDSASNDTPINIVSKGNLPEKEGMVHTFGCEAVEVYVLDHPE